MFSSPKKTPPRRSGARWVRGFVGKKEHSADKRRESCTESPRQKHAAPHVFPASCIDETRRDTSLTDARAACCMMWRWRSLDRCSIGDAQRIFVVRPACRWRSDVSDVSCSRKFDIYCSNDKV